MAHRTTKLPNIRQGDPDVLCAKQLTPNPLPDSIESPNLVRQRQSVIVKRCIISEPSLSQRRYKRYLKQNKASSRVQWAVRRGWIEKQEYCSVCDAKDNVEAHHYNYDDPLEVEWICKRCHVRFHKEIYNHLTMKCEDMPDIFISDGDIDREKTRYISESMHVVENELFIQGSMRPSRYA
ncbi:MAG: hypothetical protein V3U75_04090 [Methylococcaceae bacterium]